MSRENILHEWKMEMMMMAACSHPARKHFLSALKFKYLSKNTFCVYFNTTSRARAVGKRKFES